MEDKLKAVLNMAESAAHTIAELRAERDALRQEVQAKDDALERLRERQSLGNAIDLQKQLGSMELGEDSTEMKAHISQLINEIDDCLKLLSD